MKSTEKDGLYTEKQRLIALFEKFEEIKEFEKAEQVSDFFLKVADEEYAIAFCGHFSAGKSSLINALSNTGILPASPIPTSANIVKMKKGEPKAVVHLKNKEVVTFKYPYNIEEIKTLCKDGELVESIELFYETEDVHAANIAFYDTPGIDSTDPAHKKATEEVIHLADVIFYVMDYNHILSETNIEFIKSLNEKGKSIRLIINQIDKHQEEELSFQSFKKNVFKAFQAFGISKEQIFFTSVKSPDIPFNDLSGLVAYIKRIELNKDSLLLEETNRQLRYLVTEFVDENEKNKQKVDVVEGKLEQLYEEREKQQAFINETEQKIMDKEKNIRDQFAKIIESAQLMPYETREKAGLFIEAAKKDFKVGLFFAKQKTEQERNLRKNAFQEKLQEAIDAHINWHAQTYISTLQKELQADLPQWEAVKLNDETLYTHVQSGLASQGQGLLNYCESIAGEVKKKARQQMIDVTSLAVSKLKEENQKVTATYQNKVEKMDREIGALEKEKEESISWAEKKRALFHIVSSEASFVYAVNKYEDRFKAQFDEISIEAFKSKFGGKSVNETNTAELESVERQKAEKESLSSLQAETENLYKTASLLTQISGFSKLAEEMDQLAQRLEKRSFSAVLFGAFSAGKSSFANALFGEAILPSSPNPTTAAINEIRKPDEMNEHGTVSIEMKSENEVLNEINSILQTNYSDLNDVLQDHQEIKESKHIGAFLEGYQDSKGHLGTNVITDLSHIRYYAAVESKACYVKKITIYYSCPLTEKGLVLVDTPGANSIHSRHTEVAFEYMKQADIIIYLTYFNHAFSYADREFLIQLGRIKDTFTSDKMFFAINASDLANSEEDKHDVVNHVKDHLLSFGIRNPRLFSVSSKNELAKPGNPESGFDRFNESLYEYVENDLEQAMINSALASQIHAKNVLHNMLSETELRMKKEDEYINAVQQRENSLLDYCSKKIFLDKKQFEQEQKELLFYVKQRVLIRYHDFYKETIHPAAVRNAKAELQTCIQDLYDKLAHDLHQEFRACSLRLDRWIQKDLNDKEKKMITEAEESQVSLKTPVENRDLYFTPSLSSKFNELAGVDHKGWLSYFKNAKQFFEQGGSNELKNDLAKQVEEEIEAWILEAGKALELHYTSVIEKAEHHSKEDFTVQITNYFDELKKPGDLEARMAELKNCLEKMEY
ncbi:dynamin family protein [Fictibacillus phosphorivorans]|uniref:dynamin family protein n=1 Tax=Fictibacillus phosphorivorans TaxID=1221500 RepID=UPI00203ED1A5|nr:dynamin family protein [Fictibacillus phosphorivorans]MCM3719602.1 dynamin family protein [Fictibacillus phosphorivorans]MCM3777324.1 dynamin family protein [Fictibacillus phosphorivorans]